MFQKIKTVRDEKYLAWIRTLPCLECQKPGVSHAHHSEGGGIGMKASDYTALPLCSECHQKWHSQHGKSGGISKKRLREIQERLALCYPGELKG